MKAKERRLPKGLITLVAGLAAVVLGLVVRADRDHWFAPDLLSDARDFVIGLWGVSLKVFIAGSLLCLWEAFVGWRQKKRSGAEGNQTDNVP